MSTPQVEVLIYGLGAVGSFYAFILSRSNLVRLTVVARSNYEAVKANGIHITSQNHGVHHIYPDKVVHTAAEAGQKFDYVVCTHKATDQSSVPAQIAPAIDATRSTIVIIQNGVGNEEPFRSAYPATTIVSCVTWCGVRQPQPGFITHRKSEDTLLGLYPNENGEQDLETRRLNHFASLLAAGKTKFKVEANVQVNRWEKTVWNAAWNSLTTLTLVDTHFWLSSSEGAMPMTRRLMKEVIDIARALGIALEYDLIEKLLDRILAMPPIGSSMRTDYENGHPMEVDVILGYPVQKARELGLQTPTLETLFILLTAVNKRVTLEAREKDVESRKQD